MNLDCCANHLSRWVMHATRIIAATESCSTQTLTCSFKTGKDFNRKDRKEVPRRSQDKIYGGDDFLRALCATLAFFAVKSLRADLEFLPDFLPLGDAVL